MKGAFGLTERERDALQHALHWHKHMGWVISNSRQTPKSVCESLVKKDFLAPLHTAAELCDDDGFKAYTKQGRERFLRGQAYQLTVMGLLAAEEMEEGRL